jgi:hypothetical protein
MKQVAILLNNIFIKPLRRLFFLTPAGGRFWVKYVSRLKHNARYGKKELSIEERAAIVQHPEFYNAEYFDKGKGAGDESGYKTYVSYEKDVNLARQAKTFFNPSTSLDVGCARGFVASEQRKLGINAYGSDFSTYAISTADVDVRPFLLVSDCSALPLKRDFFDLVTCYETLEHLEGDSCRRAMDELARITKSFLWISTPCLGYNDLYFPPGWPQGKIKKEFEHLYEKEVDFPNPALLEHLALDRNGFPIEGHVTIASFRWWTENFINRGFIRRGDIEKKLAEAVYEIRTGGLNTMVFEKLKPSLNKNNQQTEKIIKIEKDGMQDNAEIIWTAGVPGEAGSKILNFDPGSYEAEFHIRFDPIKKDFAAWTRIVTCDIRSKDGQKMLGLKTIRIYNFEGSNQKAFTLRFGCNEPTHIEFKFHSPACSRTILKNSIKIKRIN